MDTRGGASPPRHPCAVTDLLSLDVASVLAVRVLPQRSKCSHFQISKQASWSVLLTDCSTTCCHLLVILTTAECSSVLVLLHSSSKKASFSGTLMCRTPSDIHCVPRCWKVAMCM